MEIEDFSWVLEAFRSYRSRIDNPSVSNLRLYGMGINYVTRPIEV